MYIPSNIPDKPPVKLLPKGIYNFEVPNAEDKRSKSNNEMIQLTLKIFDHEGKEHILWDYLVGIESQLFKAKHFLQSCGMSFENIDLKAIHCIGKSGKVEIDVQKDKSGQYPDKNVVRDYVSPPIFQEKPEEADSIDDDLPL